MNTTDLLSVLARTLSFIAQLQAAGGAIFILLFARQLTNAESAIRHTVLWSAAAAVVLSTVHYALEAARMAGELAGALDASLQQLVFESPLGTAWLIRTLGLVLILFTARKRNQAAGVLGIAGAIAVFQSFLAVGHIAEADRLWLAALLGIHLAVVGFWFGALAPLYVVSRLEAKPDAAQIVERFSRLAVWTVPLIFAAGALMMLALMDSWRTLIEGYGLLVLAKAAAFGVLMYLAALNKRRYGPLLATLPAAAGAFRRTVAIEYVLICAVLAATAVMTAFFSPQ